MKNSKPGAAKIIWLLFFITALLIFKDYGISWDEEMQQATGLVSFDYVFNNDPRLLIWTERDYGVAFELLLVIVRRILGWNAARDVFHMRHLLTHLLFLGGAWSVFLLIRLLIKDSLAAIAGMFLYLLHPRIFADSFYNTKDIPFASLYAICLYLGARAFHSGKYSHYLQLGICTGLLINTRIMGVLPFALLTGSLLLDMLFGLRVKGESVRVLKRLLLFVSVTLASLYISWPYLWSDPLGHFAEAWQHMAHFRWPCENFLDGRYIKAADLPWYYALYWFGITTPVFFLLAGACGLIAALVLLIRRPLQSFRNTPERYIWFCLLSFCGPLVAVAVLHSVLYDGWRQLFFIYPSFVLLAVLGLYCLSQYLGRKPVLIITSVCLLLQVGELIRLHPFQNVYFNRLVSREPDYLLRHYEMDYWGLAYKQSLEYLLAHDTAQQILVAYDKPPCSSNKRILFEHSRITLVDTPGRPADYFIVGYRDHPYPFDSLSSKEFHSIVVNNSRINTIFKLKQ